MLLILLHQLFWSQFVPSFQVDGNLTLSIIFTVNIFNHSEHVVLEILPIFWKNEICAYLKTFFEMVKVRQKHLINNKIFTVDRRIYDLSFIFLQTYNPESFFSEEIYQKQMNFLKNRIMNIILTHVFGLSSWRVIPNQQLETMFGSRY